MRKLMISLAAAGAALVAASPAAAQYYPQPQPAPYGYNGYNGGYGQVRALQARVDRIEWQINRLDRRDRIRDRSADKLRREADRIEERLHRAARGGLNPYEANDIQNRIARLEQRVQYAMANRYGRYNRGGNGHDGYDRDYDRNDDRGRDRDYDRSHWDQSSRSTRGAREQFRAPFRLPLTRGPVNRS